MAKGLDFIDQSTAEKDFSVELTEELFFNLSQTAEGLSSISDESLKNFVGNLQDTDDISYVFKFISDKEILYEMTQDISNPEQSSFSQLFHDISTEPPKIFEAKAISLNEKGSFIAFVNKEKTRLEIIWKNEASKEHLFNSLLDKVKSQSIDYPQEFRSFGTISIFLDKDNALNIEFYGNSAKNAGLCYAPGYLKMFEEDLRSFFIEKFQENNVKLHF